MTHQKVVLHLGNLEGVARPLLSATVYVLDAGVFNEKESDEVRELTGHYIHFHHHWLCSSHQLQQNGSGQLPTNYLEQLKVETGGNLVITISGSRGSAVSLFHGVTAAVA